jgi:hypothetical protein
MKETEGKDIHHLYDRDSFLEIVANVVELRGFVEVLKVYSTDEDAEKVGQYVSSMCSIMEKLIAPVDDFMGWAATYLEFPEEKLEGGAA